jgi:hypothetical protein
MVIHSLRFGYTPHLERTKVSSGDRKVATANENQFVLELILMRTLRARPISTSPGRKR